MGLFRAETWTVQAKRAEKMRKLQQKEQRYRYRKLRAARRKRWLGI